MYSTDIDAFAPSYGPAYSPPEQYFEFIGGVQFDESRLEKEIENKMYQQLRLGVEPLDGVEPNFARPETCPEATLSVYDWLKDKNEYAMFLSLINLAGLEDLFADPNTDEFTVFIPTNDAVVRAF